MASGGTTISSGGGVVDRYAAALYAHAEDVNQLDQVVLEMTNLGKLIDESADFRRLLESPLIDINQARTAAFAVLDSYAFSKPVRDFVGVIANNRRLRILRSIVNAFAELVAQKRGVVVARDAIHQTADGRRFLVLHGDEFDGVVRHAPALALAGDLAYRIVLSLNTHLNRLRRRLGFGYWSLSAFLKSKVKNALQFIDSFEHAVSAEAHRRGVDGVICGHIHKAQMRDIDGIAYINDGDWVESCTALVEHTDGRLEILEWASMRSWSMIERTRRVEAPESLTA